MSAQAFADFYEKHVNGPGGSALRARIEATRDTAEYIDVLLAAGQAAGADFSADDIRTVIVASEAAVAKAAGDSGALSEDQLAEVAGGLLATTSFSGVPVVRIQTVPNYLPSGVKLSSGTLMCSMIG